MTPTPGGPGPDDKITTLGEMLDITDARPNAKGGWYGYCLSHGSRRRSLEISFGDRQPLIFYCHGGARCSTLDIAQSVGLARAADLYSLAIDVERGHARSAGPQSPGPEALAEMAARVERYALAFRGSQSEHYALDRFGIGAEDAARLRLGHATDCGVRLIIPYMGNSGAVLGFLGRDLTGLDDARWRGPSNPPGGGAWARFAVLRSRPAAEAPAVIITESPGDGLTAVAAGFDAVSARGATMADSPAGRAELAAAVAPLKDARPVLVCGDNDRDGRRFTGCVCSALTGALALDVPAPHNDLTDWRVSDPEAFPGLLRNAVEHAVQAAEDAEVEEVLRSVVGKIHKHPEGRMRRTELNRRLSAGQRPRLDPALAMGVARGVLMAEPIAGRGRAGTAYRLTNLARGWL